MNEVINISRENRNWAELVFFAIFIPWLALVILSKSTLFVYFYRYGEIINIFKIVFPLCFLAIKVILLDKGRLTTKLLSILILVMLYYQFISLVYNDDLLLACILIVGAWGVEYRKILKVYLFESLALVILTTILALTGLIPHVINHRNGHTRYALGSIWCTDYAARIFFLLVILLYLYSARMKIYHWLLLLIPVGVVFWATNGRLDFICMLLAITVFFVQSCLEKKTSPSKSASVWTQFWKKTAPFITPACAVFMTVLTLLYTSSNPLLARLNGALSGRLTLGQRAFSDIGVSFFGQYVVWIGMGGVTNDVTPKGYNFVDCSYLNILFTFGVVLALAVIALFSYLAYKNRKNTRFILVIALISFNSIVAHHLIDVAYSPIPAALFAIMPAVAITSHPSGAESEQKKGADA
ncbi:MAG: hypothetical protein J5750_05810 [Clostridiales bacterium]|nr:hypothetical protein [Clostridiales bacterium]